MKKFKNADTTLIRKEKKQMKDKIYKKIGQAVTYIVGYLIVEAVVMNAGLYIINNCLTTIK